ncbi:MAG: polyhydroxyalkanoate synthesis regulator DNA-binding domain-containing protein [Deltaproteobacteria bacterium]
MADDRIIKRYANRKLYDKHASRYVTLDGIAELLRKGEDIKVIDNDSGDDLTAVTFAQIILEEEKSKKHFISVSFLRRVIRDGEERIQDFSDRATHGIEVLGGLTERALGESISFFDDLFGSSRDTVTALRQAAASAAEKFRANPTVNQELARVESSLRSLEEAISRLHDDQEQAPDRDNEGAVAATVEEPDPSEKTGV